MESFRDLLTILLEEGAFALLFMRLQRGKWSGSCRAE